MVTAIENRWRRFRVLLAFGWFLGFFYGDSLRHYPLGIAARMLAARLAYVIPLPLLLPDRRFLLNHQGARIYRQLNSSPLDLDLALGTYEYWKGALFSRLVKEGMTILDVGANEGYYSIMWAKLMHDKGRVLAFEPDPKNSHWLKKNISANGYTCIELHEYALSDKEGETTFYPGGGVGSLVDQNTDLALLQEPGNTINVRTRTLDNVLRDANIKNVDLMKIDVEGADLLVLKGAQHALKSMNVRILMDVDVSGYERKELFDLLHSCGFSLYLIGRELKPLELPLESSVPPTRRANEGVGARHGSSNALSPAKSRLKNMLPASITSVLAILFYHYLCVPIRWFRAPQDAREIYAAKSSDAGRSR